jgi:ABC-type polysaccharide/polyol phosphate transport system ATPase subunit
VSLLASRRTPAGHGLQLGEDILLSLQNVSKKAPKPPPQPPRWLARFLPGVEWSAAGDIDDETDDEDDLDDDDLDVPSRLSPIRDMSFDLRAGTAMGLVGPDTGARRALLWMIAGFVPPAEGRILIRGTVAPLFNATEMNVTRQIGERAVKLTSRYFDWPWELIQSRWDEIVEFARIDDIKRWPADSVEFEGHRTKRLLLSTALHMDASIYLVGGNFYAIEPEFVQRCHHLLHRRLGEGCAVIHSIGTVENLAHFCNEAIYIDNGRALLRGRLGEVARFAHDRPATMQPGAARLPLRAALLDDGPVRIGADGGAIEIELDVFAKRIELAYELVLVDGAGRRVRIEAPDRLAAAPGIYRLEIELPPGVLHEATYDAELLASPEDDPLEEPSEAHSLLTFQIVSSGGSLPGEDPERVVEARWTLAED